MGELTLPSQLRATLAPPQQPRIEGTLGIPATLSGQIQRGPYGVPMINGVPLVGDVSLPQLGLRGVYYDTTENWNLQRDFIAVEGSVYIYSDFTTEDDGDGHLKNIPSMKIGDGTTPLIDLPFIASQMADTIVTLLMDNIVVTLSDRRMLVTAADREKWDRKVTCLIDPDNDGNLILTY